MTSRISLEDFEQKISGYVDVTNNRLGTSIVSFSDEWFADASNLIKPTPPIQQIGKFTPKGAWYDGWETRRHNPEEADWVIIKVGVNSAKIIGVEIDTAFFNGNHAAAISVEGVYIEGNKSDKASFADANWSPIIPQIECGPTQRHFFIRDEGLTDEAFNYLRLRMYPDGGIARFRAYGKPIPVFPADKSATVDLASVSNGGVVVGCSNRHYSSPNNLLLPGRGHDMSDGWETARSRVKGNVEWVIVKLGAPGHINKVVVDTAYFLGNYPVSIKIDAIKLETEADLNKVTANDSKWKQIVGEARTGPGAEHEYDLTSGLTTNDDELFTHVKLTIIPDGGVKRLRVFGTRS